MIKISVPATSANLGSGFDVVGISLSLYNIFYFEKDDSFTYKGFEEKYCNDNNLVKKAYEYVFKKLNKKVIPLSITIENHIPIARGLGSSSTCIIAGVLAANYYLKNLLNEKEIINYCIEIEGHPDNVVAALKGGFIASYKTKDEYKTIKYNINKKLKFIVVVPPFELSTKESREVLPKSVSYFDTTFNLSRIILLPLAIQKGNIELLIDSLDDKLHQPYRLPLIKHAKEIKELALQNKYAFCLSGSGPTLLLIGKSNKIVDNLKQFGYEIKELEIGEKAKMEEKE